MSFWLKKIEGPVWHPIYHHRTLLSSNPSMKINQWEKDIYDCHYIPIMVGVIDLDHVSNDSIQNYCWLEKTTHHGWEKTQ
jgi:hypothetical protein